jgi:argininosuccinate lyase
MSGPRAHEPQSSASQERQGRQDSPSQNGRLWGGRFTEAPDAAAWALGRSTDVDARLWSYDLAGSKAHADQLLAAGILSEEDVCAIRSGLDRIESEFAEGTFAFASGDEDLHGAVERRLLEICGPVGGRLRAGRSRNDQIAADLRGYCRDAATRLAELVCGLQRALADQAEATADWLAPGYTHLQRAQPVTLGHHLLAHAWALERDVERLTDGARRADVCTLAAGALAGTSLALDPQAYADALGFGATAENSLDAVADRDFAVDLVSPAAMLGVHLSRLGEEVVLWSSAEFAWAQPGDAFSTGSSLMPQKRNPDVAELARGKAGRLVGDLTTLLTTLKGLPLAYNRDLQEDKHAVFDAVDTLELTVPAMTGQVASLSFDRDRLEDAARTGSAQATDLADALVAAGVPFRQAHERVGALVAECERSGIELADADPQQVLSTLPELGTDPARVRAVLDPAAAIGGKGAKLGPAPEQVRTQLERLRQRLSDTPSGSGRTG